MEMLVKKLCDEAILPSCATQHSAGYDLYALNKYELVKGSAPVMIRTGISIEVKTDNPVVILLTERSSIGKRGINLANGVWIIDQDYRGEICVMLQNTCGQDIEIINQGDRIAQLIMLSISKPEVIEVAELSDTVRGSGGFGSTGK